VGFSNESFIILLFGGSAMVKKMYFLGMTLALVSCVLMLPDTSYGGIRDGLISAWPLDDETGTTALDEVGANDGDIRGGAGQVMGKFGLALSFDGADSGTVDSTETDYVDCGSDASLKPANVSVSAWIKIDAYSYYGQIAGFAFDSGASESGYSIMTDDYYVAGSEPSLAMWLSAPAGDSDGSYLANTNLPSSLNDWIHVVGTYDGTTVTVYINGVGVSGTAETGDIDYQHVTTFKIGLYAASAWWLPYEGLIDDVAVWDRALTQQEIDWLYNAGSGRPAPVTSLMPTPHHASLLVPRSQVLSWELVEEMDVVGYDVWFGTDANEISPNYDFTKVLDTTTDTTFDPFGEDPLDFEQKYYWRVDIHEANDVGTIFREGRLWRFTTMPPVPLLDPDLPAAVVIDAGQTATFVVDAINPVTEDDTGMTYEWLKAGDPTVLSTTDTLEITNAQIANEGRYYCVVTITENGETSTSREASLTIKRLLGHWPFDRKLTDLVGGNDAGYTGTKASWETGIDGMAIDFTDTTSAATISLTPYSSVGWTLSWWDNSSDVPPANNWESMVANGPTTGFEILESDRLNIFTYSTGFNATGSWATTTTYPRGEWNHHVLSHDPVTGSCKWYINGVEFASLSGVNLDEFDPDLYLGNCKDGTQGYEGLIDDLKLYNYSLSAIEAALIYTDMTGEVVCFENPEYDFNEDCVVDVLDLTAFLGEWMECSRYPATFCE
jgi:hypothetical protein